MSAEEGWDFVTQRNETAWTVHHLNTEKGVALGTAITLDLNLVPGTDAQEEALIRALGMFGYAAARADEGEGVQVSVPDLRFGVAEIWLHEERITKIALARGYTPDGWGFWEP